MRGWTEIQLEDALEVLIDYRGKSPKKSETGIPVISAKVVKSGRVLDGIEQTIAPDYYVEWMRRGVPQAGDVVMTTEGPLGEVARLDETSAQYALGQRIVTMRGREGVLDNGFLKYLLMSSGIQERLQSRATGSTVAGISQKSLRSLPLPLAPFAEQREIASILGALDDKIELNRRMSPTLEEMARSLYKSWFVDFDPVHAKMEGRQPAFMDEATAALFPDRFGEDGLPEGWERSTIGHVAEIVGGGTPKGKEPEFWENGHHLWATPKDLSHLGQSILLDTARKITDAGLAKISSRLSPPGTLLLSSRAPIGYLALAAYPVAVNQGFIAIRETSMISGMEAYFWCAENMELIHANANGSTFQEISKKNFRPMEYILATGEVRRAFNGHAGTIFERVTKLCQENMTLSSLRDSLLPKLMSGELRVGEAREQVEEVA